jgi:sulfonate transport system substrate-binding protein
MNIMIGFKSHQRFTVIFLVWFVVIVFFAVGCQPAKQAVPPEKVTIGYVSACISILAHIALSKGYFAEEGLDATPQHHTSGKGALQSVIEGKADFATVATTPILFSILNGQQTMLVAAIEATSTNEAILVKKSSGIENPANLKGKTIGLVVGAAGDYFADVLLKANKISRAQVKIVNTMPEDMAAALNTGRVDAVSTWNPLFFQRQLEKVSGDKGRLFYGETLFTEIGCMAATHDYVRKHPETVKKVLRALIKAEGFARQSPKEARQVVANFVPEMDRPILDLLWPDLFLRVSLDQSLVVDLEDQTKWAINSGLTKRKDMPNYLDFIYLDGLRAVRPESVRIAR